MKALIVSLVIIAPIVAMPYRIRLTKWNIPQHPPQRAFSAVAKDILASVKPHQQPIFKKYLEYEKMIHLLRDSEKKVLNELLQRKLFLEAEFKNNPELNEPYKRFTSAVQEYFSNLAQTMFAPTKKVHDQYSNDPTDEIEIHEKELLHHIAQQINMDVENFKGTCVEECLEGLTKQQ